MERSDPRRRPADDSEAFAVYSQSMRELVDLARRVAHVDSTVLITGESGVGKEQLARLIHRTSPRAAGPFISVNCAALPDALIESELFGHVRGAFTGALHDRPGLFEAADHGTLLLDEIGDVPLSTQAKLLRVLQEHEVRRVGENRQRAVSVRLIAATNRNLAEDVSDRRFRRDLFYRLKVVQFHVPPLRDRPDDLAGLAHLLLTKIAGQMHLTITGFADEALAQLIRYSWPGNVRELENAIERACALADGPLIEPQDLPEELRAVVPSLAPPQQVRPLRDVEREHILAVLQRNGGNKTQTAEQLGIAVATLSRKLKQYVR